jgi:hypothetical protein
MCGLIFELPILFIWSRYSVSYQHHSILITLQQSWNDGLMSLALFLLKTALDIQRLLWFYVNIRICLFHFCDMEILIGIALNLYIALGNMDLNILILLTHEHRIYYYLCIFNFFHQHFIVCSVEIVHFLVKFIVNYFILFDTIINEIIY